MSNKTVFNKVNKDLYTIFVNGVFFGYLESFWQGDNKLWEFQPERIAGLRRQVFDTKREAEEYFKYTDF